MLAHGKLPKYLVMSILIIMVTVLMTDLVLGNNWDYQKVYSSYRVWNQCKDNFLKLGSPRLFQPLQANINCNLRQAASCDLIQVNRHVLMKKNMILFLDGYIFNIFQRVKTYQYKGNYLSIWKVRRYLLILHLKATRRNF